MLMIPAIDDRINREKLHKSRQMRIWWRNRAKKERLRIEVSKITRREIARLIRNDTKEASLRCEWKGKLTCAYLCVGIRLLSRYTSTRTDMSISVLCLFGDACVDTVLWSKEGRDVDRKTMTHTDVVLFHHYIIEQSKTEWIRHRDNNAKSGSSQHHSLVRNMWLDGQSLPWSSVATILAFFFLTKTIRFRSMPRLLGPLREGCEIRFETNVMILTVCFALANSLLLRPFSKQDMLLRRVMNFDTGNDHAPSGLTSHFSEGSIDADQLVRFKHYSSFQRRFFGHFQAPMKDRISIRLFMHNTLT